MVTVKRLIPILTLFCALLLQACVSVKSTAVFYTPSTSVVYPPKPDQAVIPIMNQAPSRPYAEIGRFSFQTGFGYPFLMRAVEYNAHRVGADAVLIREVKSWTIPRPYSVPPTLGWIPVGGWYGLLAFCLLKTIAALGYCPASKLFACMQKGGCCALTRRC